MIGKEFNPYDLGDIADLMERFPDPDRPLKRFEPIDGRSLNPYDLNDVALINDPNRQRRISFGRRRHVRNHNHRGLLKDD